MNTVAVLMTSFNRKNKTLIAIESFIKSTLLMKDFIFDFYLVDDCSKDGTVELIKNNFPFVTIINGDGNLFWCRGMDCAWNYAANIKDYDFFLWYNDDNKIFENALPLIFSETTIYKNSIITGAFQSENNNLVTYGGLINDSFVIPNGVWQEIDLLNGNLVSIPKKVFNSIGTFDTYFHHGMADFDYGLRAKKNGFKILLTPYILGYCERHDDEILKCFDINESLLSRLNFLYSPKGPNPFINSLFFLRHYSLLHALSFFFKNNIATLFPYLIGKRKKIFFWKNH